MNEIWVDVIGYEGLYRVSNLGRVMSLLFARERIMKTPLSGDGYYSVKLCRNREFKFNKIHRLVYESFNGRTELVIDHINNVKTDNRLSNLQPLTYRQNATKYRLTTSKTSEYVGVNWNKQNSRWVSKIRINGKQKHLGQFKEEYNAAEAYYNELIKL